MAVAVILAGLRTLRQLAFSEAKLLT